jgi:hypothetical protein
MLTRRLIGGLAIGVFTFSGCSMFGDGGSDSKVMAEVISLLPALPEEQSTIFISDFVRIGELNESERPASDASSEVAKAYLTSIFSPPSDEEAGAVAGDWFTGADVDAFRDELGFSVLDVDLLVETGPGPGFMRLVQGSFDAQQVSEAAATDPVWSDLLEEVGYEGETYLSWGGDSEQDSGEATAARPLGIGGRLWVQENLGVWTHDTSGMEAAIAAASGDGDKLIDDPSYLEVAEALDAESAYNAILVRGPSAAGLLEGSDAEILAVGESFAEDSFRDLLIVAAPSEERASEIAAGLEDTLAEGQSVRTERKWTDLFGECEATAEGSIVVVDCEVDSQPIFRDALFSQDLPLLP